MSFSDHVELSKCLRDLPRELCALRDEEGIAGCKCFGSTVRISQCHRPRENSHHLVNRIALDFFLAGRTLPNPGKDGAVLRREEGMVHLAVIIAGKGFRRREIGGLHSSLRVAIGKQSIESVLH